MAHHVARSQKRRISLAVGAALAVAGGATLLTLPAGAAPAEGTVYAAGAKGAVKGSYVVMLKESPGRHASAVGVDLAKEYGGKVRRTYGSAVNGFSATGLSAAEARRLAADGKVDKVVQNQRFRATGTQKNPPSWGLDRIDQAGTKGDKKYTYPDGGGAGVTAYVLDTGVRIGHKDFGGRASYGYDAVDDDSTAQDGNGHGTHVAGTVAGAKYGVAKKAKIVAVRVLDNDSWGTTEQIVGGVDWVTKNHKGPSVANMSLGGEQNIAMDEAVKRSIAAGVTYAISAGNDTQDATKASPARVPEAITVAASDVADNQAAFSNFGKRVDLYGPGVDIVSASNKSDTATTTMSGTSMAAPHVTGAAALYVAAHKKATPRQVSAALVKGATSGAIADATGGTPNELLRVPK
ncbi:S8 family peptidase [Streptomyces iconiensis]|uniref:S8 family serine peptidase n=1 Tax=Streptomyces iconiensis TaxID=1384038 RepID=A0ABT6ZQH4_9ACTN|nr:S8 family peptidase [Streptomyces iconiensis]MDJ1131315.1 S8 family serine peptidase [Streptomyces iconiensis]